jgi:hypothetical protein
MSEAFYLVNAARISRILVPRKPAPQNLGGYPPQSQTLLSGPTGSVHWHVTEP